MYTINLETLITALQTSSWEWLKKELDVLNSHISWETSFKKQIYNKTEVRSMLIIREQ